LGRISSSKSKNKNYRVPSPHRSLHWNKLETRRRYRLRAVPTNDQEARLSEWRSQDRPFRLPPQPEHILTKAQDIRKSGRFAPSALAVLCERVCLALLIYWYGVGGRGTYRHEERELSIVQRRAKDEHRVAAVAARLVQERVEQRVALQLDDDVVHQPDRVTACATTAPRRSRYVTSLFRVHILGTSTADRKRSTEGTL
jgi:hypothetical protein